MHLSLRLLTRLTLLLLVVLMLVTPAPVHAKKKKKPTTHSPTPAPAPRVRREWRTLTDVERAKVAKAMWTLKTTTTAAGRKKYGAAFNNHDDMLLLHSCAVYDIRCDNGHFGPQFMTFHRAFLLKYELSLLAVDASIGALPYWNVANDAAHGAYRNDPSKYIYTDKYFGNYTGTSATNYSVLNGLFANWPIALYTEARFGKTSTLALTNQCVREEWFKPKPCSNATGAKTYLRDHADCTPVLARNPHDPTSPNSLGTGLGGSFEIVYTEADFAACHDASNILHWMDWQNCIEFGSVSCGPNSDLEPAASVITQWPPLPNTSPGCAGSNLMGTFVAGSVVATPPPVGKVTLVNFFHSMPHLKAGLDLKDVTTSPNDPGSFTGHHANVDRNNMIWQNAQAGLAADYWGYPKTNSDLQAAGRSPVTTSGPFSLYDLGSCGNNSHFSQYTPGQYAWILGTSLDEAVNSGFAFFDLFPCTANEVDSTGKTISCSGKPNGYTHREILYWTAPGRAPYTYDSLT